VTSTRDPADVERRRKLAKALEGALPDDTHDERPEGWGERESSGNDERLRSEVPPHHG